MSKKLLIAGNWKLNGDKKDISFIKNLLKFNSKKLINNVDILICPPFTLIDKFCQLTQRSKIEIGAQDCSEYEIGAYTGEVSASMLSDLKASYCIIGHSERRFYHNENNNLLNKKILNIQKNNIKAILCIGESLSDRKKSKTLRVLGNQLKGALKNNINPNLLEIAYEPIWAIGTGLVPESDIEEVHDYISRKLEDLYGKRSKKIRIIYGGSVNAKNVFSILSLNNVNGALIGGASLKIKDMKSILKQFI
ncbi:triose-phosphate isomerase [OCS116 cluster bacterium]|nr:triose-phosphate isomerase [OCS116 cluster bacterium]